VFALCPGHDALSFSTWKSDMYRSHRIFRALGLIALGVSASVAQAASDQEARALEELRNTVVNLLQGLVDRGVLTREQAEKMVQDAQGKAQSTADARAAQDAAEQTAVRVPYVPQIVKDEIRKQVEVGLREQVTKDVIDTAQAEYWGVPAALPDWVKRMRWYGDMRVRGEGIFYASDNVPNVYLDFQRINTAGGIGKAGISAFANTTEDRQRLRARLRVGFEATLGYGWTMGARLASGSLADPVSTNQTLGSTGYRYQLGMETAYIDWTGNNGAGRQLSVSGGRIRSPWFTPTDLVFDQDLMFDGVAANYRFGLENNDPSSHFAFATIGVFPLQELELATDKWLVGGQFGVDWKFQEGSRLRVGAGVYQFRHTAGKRNVFESNLLDYSAPQYLRQGNTVFDIRNDNDTSTNLFALAADYELANLSVAYDWSLASRYRISLAADYVLNFGYDNSRILERTGYTVAKRNTGYQAEIGFGSLKTSEARAWRAALGYRYLERDAVLDAFTDSDFRLGGTDAKGFSLGLDYYLTPKVMARFRYLSGNEIDGPPLGIDVLQLDLTTTF
jgi:polyhydroxyalkanoate synthesis regulator phasin